MLFKGRLITAENVVTGDLYAHIDGTGHINISDIKATGVESKVCGLGVIKLNGNTYTSIFDTSTFGQISVPKQTSKKTIAKTIGY